MDNQKAVYGIMSWTGNAWSVYFEADKDGKRVPAVEGVDEFPFARFPGIPVIDFRPANGKMLMDIPDAKRPAIVDGGYPGTLAEYIEAVERCGAFIIRSGVCPKCGQIRISGCSTNRIINDKCSECGSNLVHCFQQS